MNIWYINLDRRPDRDRSMKANLRAKGVPEDRIVRFTATDRDAYENPASLINYGISVGFQEFYQCLNHKGIHQFLGYMISYFRALRRIADLGLTYHNESQDVLLMEDDYHIKEDYSDLCASWEELPRQNLKLAMIGYNVWGADMKRDLPKFNDTWNIGPPSNGNSANIYTPEGAAYVLAECKKKMDTTPECVIQHLLSDGIYSRNPDKMGIITSPAAGESNVMDGRWT